MLASEYDGSCVREVADQMKQRIAASTAFQQALCSSVCTAWRPSSFTSVRRTALALPIGFLISSAQLSIIAALISGAAPGGKQASERNTRLAVRIGHGGEERKRRAPKATAAGRIDLNHAAWQPLMALPEVLIHGACVVEKGDDERGAAEGSGRRCGGV